MNIPLYQVDAFTEELFGGNPAAVCIIDHMLPDALMQDIAAENNLSETAFVLKEGDKYRLRWFTPVSEVDLCGHATLATSHVLFNHLKDSVAKLEYVTRSGILTATLAQEKETGAADKGAGAGAITLNFPVDVIGKSETPAGLADALGIAPLETYKGKTDYMLIYESEADILAMQPDFHRLKQLPCRGIIVTAPGSNADFVSRFFAPLEGINEDPVTGSAHTTLAPYWAKRLGKTEFLAHQLSKRRGVLEVRLADDRVEITGRAVTYMTATICVADFDQA